MAEDWFSTNAPQAASASDSDWFAQNHPSRTPSAPTRAPAQPDPNAVLQAPGSAVGSFVSGLASNLNPLPLAKTLFRAAGRDPQAAQDIQSLPGRILSESGQNLSRSKDALLSGHPLDSAYYALGSVPLVGPPAVHAGEQFATGNEAQGLGEAAGLISPFLTRFLPKRLPVPPVLRNHNNPVEEAALASTESAGVPMTPGQRSGNRALSRVEQGMENLPGSSNRAHEFFTNQRESLASRAESLASSPSPVSTNAYGAGKGIQTRLQSHVADLKGQADALYEDVRASAAANQKSLQVGHKPITDLQGNTLVDPQGKPLLGPPVMKTFESPVDLKPLQASLRPIYEDLRRSMPIARQDASPAFATLKDIMSRRMATDSIEASERYMNAMDFDRALGAVKSLTRDGQSPYLSSISQGVAKQIVKQGEYELRHALGDSGEALSKLQDARKLVRQYYDTADLLGDLHSEPAALYQNLISGGDRVYDTLTKLQTLAPAEMKVAGRTFLEGMVDKATAEGGFGRAAGVIADWRRMGPKTKAALFGPQLATDLDDFFLAAKRLTTSANPSGTAHLQTALGAAGATAGALLGTLMGHGSLGAAAGVIGSNVIGPNLASRILFSPGAAKALTQTLSLPVGSPGFTSAVEIINKAAIAGKSLPPPPK